LLALVAFLLAAFVFALRLFDADIDILWGFLAVAVGLALMCLPEGWSSWRPRRGA